MNKEEREKLKESLKKLNKKELTILFSGAYSRFKDKKIEDLPEGWREIVLTDMEAGTNLVVVLKKIGMSRTIHARFMVDYPQYAEIFTEGQMMHEAFWVDWARQNLQNKVTAQVTLWYMYMKNNFGWRDAPLPTRGKGGLLDDKTKEQEFREQFRKVTNEKVENLN